MVQKQLTRSERTKQDIVNAAGKLFSKRGFDVVTMREIAQEAGCSHTTIYIYFENKLALLHYLSMPPLQNLKQQMEEVMEQTNLQPKSKLKTVSQQFIHFCLSNRTMVHIFFYTKPSRVDEEKPEIEVNKIRIELFNLIKQSLQTCLQIEDNDPRMLSFGRIYFYTLHGIVGTYENSEESPEELIKRLDGTFDDTIDVLLYGFHQKVRMEAEHK
ncbi:TetR/AcrR family transcriptional regulator [Pseudogracilibacillus auburnensis]|uniref:TetR family transcriptional regulator n=1 Tax=Pseudogracilibacillus auburnensis TaxID=1494959 RepID=A0A2V3WDY5_9BACI|nr:TetR/AcrR family transcriptional regulator [Pseudogracilibacillus auburnensis]PXW90425.1 TetR family transcriptional regulator [Pseudogracilibacillus auburnensis]